MDFIIIDGGATGFAIAFFAATQVYRNVLLEQSDFARATSIRSHMVVQGGVLRLR